MSTKVAYPFKRIDMGALDVTVSHDLEDTKNSLLSVTKTYKYSCEITPSLRDWPALWGEAGVAGGTLAMYWVSGGAGSRELLQRCVCNGELPQAGEEGARFSFEIPGHQHTENAAVILRVVSTDRKLDDDLGAEAGGLLWEKTLPVEVSGAGALMKVEYAAAPAGKGLSAGPGEYSYSPDRGYELVVYTSRLHGGSHAEAPASHGAVAVLLERVLRDAFARLKELENTATSAPGNEEDVDELSMLKNILGPEHKIGRTSPQRLLEQEAKSGSRDPNHALFNWCWEVAGYIAYAQIEVLRKSTDRPAEEGGEK